MSNKHVLKYSELMRNDSFGISFGYVIQKKRKKMGLSQSELSFKAEVSLDSIRSLESGRIKSPGLLVSYKLANSLGTSLDSLMLQIEKELKKKC